MNIKSATRTLFLLFNHCLTATWDTEARTSLGVDRIALPPLEISRRWVEIPPDAEELVSYLAPVFT
jgi:hypothetical protein